MATLSNGDGLHQQQLKRHHLNLLIQGAAVHASIEPCTGLWVNALDRNALVLNERVGVGIQLSQFEARSYVLAGSSGGDPHRFWGGISDSAHPFAGSRLLGEHGIYLVDRGYEYACHRAASAGILLRRRYGHDRKLLDNMKDLHRIESGHREFLQELAIGNVVSDWGVPKGRLRARLQAKNQPGLMLPGQERPAGARGFLQSACSAGWSRVVFPSDGPPIVEAAALVLPLLRHELVKGVCELAAIHGLACLDDETYNAVVSVTDRIELERFAMQAGHELFRLWQASVPDRLSTLHGLMHLSLADPDIVESVLIAAVEDPESARQIMTHVCASSIIELE